MWFVSELTTKYIEVQIMGSSKLLDAIRDIASTITGTTTKRIVVVICATQADGTITPVKCDAVGQLIFTAPVS